MPDPKAQENKDNALHFKMMGELFKVFADNSHQEWREMKYVRAKPGRPGHESKKKFDEYRRYVYEQHKLSLHRAKLCDAAATALLEGVDIEPEKPDSGVKRAGKVILGNFKNLIP